MRRWPTLVLALGAGACAGGEGEAPPVANHPFCQEVMPRVETFLAGARTDHPVPTDARYGGTLVTGTIGELTNGMMSVTTADHGSTQHQQFVNLMTLIDYDAAYEPRPYLAESWEVDEGVTEITFRLRPDVFWHDGTPTTARDVAFTYRLATDPRTGFPNSAFWTHYVRGPEGVEVVDDLTVKVHLRPHAEYMDVWRTLAILPEHLLGDVPPETLREHPYASRCPVGNGPFVFREHRDHDRWVFDANPAFPEALGGRPYVDTYVYRIIPDQSTLLNELLAGSIHVYVGARSDQAEQIRGAAGVELVQAPFRDFVYVGWNGRRPQLADARVRRAITMGVDRATMVDALLGGLGTVANSTLLPFHWAYDPAQPNALPYDPEAARALLSEAGWEDRDGDGVREDAGGRRLAIEILYNQGNQTRQRMVEVMQVQLREVGVELSLRSLEWGSLWEQVAGRAFDGVVIAWVGEFKVDDSVLFHSSHADGEYAFSGTRNARLDALMDSLSLIVDREEAKPLWARYEAELIREQPYTFLYFLDRFMGVREDVEGVVLDPRGEWVSVRDWWLPGSRR